MNVRRALAIVALVSALPAPAAAAQSTYRWQISNGATYGGYTTNWSVSCGNNLSGITGTAVTTMTTGPFCNPQPGRLSTLEPSPFEMLLMIKPTAYAQTTTVTGISMRWRLRDRSGPGGFTMRFHIGYAQGGTFISFGWVERTVSSWADVLYLPDTSGISGTAPSGSNLAVMAELVTNANSNEVRIYLADDRNNGDDSSEVTVDETVVSNDTVLGDGVNPANATVCPGDGAADLDAFTLATSGGNDTVSAVQVTLTTGSAPFLSLIEVVSDDGATVYGSTINPGADVLNIALGTPIGVTTTTTQYRLRITPVGHAAMPVPPGSLQAVTGTVTGVTAGNSVTGSDTTSATVAVDNQSPGDPIWGTIVLGDGQIALNWTNPADTDFAGVVILRNTVAVADTPSEGATYSAGNTIGASTVIYVGTGTGFTDTGLTNGADYYYAIFARDNCVNYSVGAGTGPHRPRLPVNSVTVQPASASAPACNRVVVTAPFADDDNGNSTTLVERGTTASGPWTTVCAGLTGASPRTCTDNGVAESTTYYYQVTFSDVDGVNGTNPQVLGPVSTPVCGVDNTTVVGSDVLASSCDSLTVTSRFSGDDNGDGSTLMEYNTADSWPGTTACAAVGGLSPRQCLISGLTPGQTYWVRVTFSDPDGVSGTNPEVLGPVTLGSCGADAVAPTLLILAPSEGAVIGGPERVNLQVWDEGGLAATPISWYVDGGAASTAATVNSNYSCGTNCTIYQFDLDTTTLANGMHEITVNVTDAAGNVGRAVRAVTVNNAGVKAAGSGQLLRRTHGAQICVDCHALATHSSQHTGVDYGNWAVDCLRCHTPHKTRNIFLVREQLNTPSSGTAVITFQVADTTGGTNPENSYLGVTTGAGGGPFTDGICETCHTKTSYHRNNLSADHSHNANYRCVGCHPHSQGFAAGESTGGVTCASCHPDIWQGMTGGVAKTSRHALGAVLGTNDSFTDTAVSWTAPLSGVAPADRSCVNMCHQDHIHNAPGATLHEYNAHEDARTQASRAVGRNAGGEIVSGTPARTDFDPAAASGGTCVSCHQSAVSAGRPAIDAAAYDVSAHDYTSFGAFGAWTYTLHDGSTFDRNCTKCHADRGDARPGTSTNPFGAVHFSDFPKLLSGSFNPAGVASTFQCYTCHGNGSTGQDLSGKDLATVVAKTISHPVEDDAVHDTVAESASTYDDGSFSGAGRHVSCMDCHAPHAAGSTSHDWAATATSTRNQIGTDSPLKSVFGVVFNFAGLANFAPTTSPEFSPAASATNEYEICLKCHSSFGFGTNPPNGLSPNGSVANPVETDVAQEFNPANKSRHPVVAGTGATGTGTSPLVAVQMRAPWN
ncbi:MAG: hypothetical protein ACC742_12225, partial [Thermoanaerobaculales bacterium]